jgi:shikimate dehydrogenase
MHIFGLIGTQLGHSRSKSFFEDKFRKEGLSDFFYQNFPIRNAAEVRELVVGNPAINGLNVTIPFKKEIMDWLDFIDEDAMACGAVNVISIQRTPEGVILAGHNTDHLAFASVVRPLLKPWHTGALLLGTGGAAGAVKHALSRMNITVVNVSRHPVAGQISYREVSSELISGTGMIINATPLGMHPYVGDFPQIAYESLNPRHLLFDLVYNPEETVFLRKGTEQGAQVENGLKMLYAQAELSWNIWTG